jgi:cytochrome c oxidase subunit 4
MAEKHSASSIPFLTGIYITLMVLLVLTVLAAEFPLGPAALLVALLIAGAKALLVILYFMHVRHAEPITRVFVSAGFVWLAILFTLTWLEVATR